MSLSDTWWNVTFSFWVDTTPVTTRVGIRCHGSRDDVIAAATRKLIQITDSCIRDLKVDAVLHD